jgi:hypothetical protein
LDRFSESGLARWLESPYVRDEVVVDEVIVLVCLFVVPLEGRRDVVRLEVTLSLLLRLLKEGNSSLKRDQYHEIVYTFDKRSACCFPMVATHLLSHSLIKD